MVLQGLSLKDKVAMVAGNQSHRLKAIALALTKAEAKVVIAAPESVKPELDGADVQTVDITKAKEINKLVKEVVAQRQRIDILVNCADFMLIKPFTEISQAEWQQVMDVNITSTFLWCQAAGKQMLSQKRGRIINVISGLSQRGMANGAAYCASKGAVQQMTAALALEWAKEGIRVNAIGLGWFAGAIQPDARLERYLPLRRLGTEDDLTSLIVYLACDASEFITGASFFIDGGAMAHA